MREQEINKVISMIGYYSLEDISEKTKIPIEYIRAIYSSCNEKPEKPTRSAVAKGYFCPNCNSVLAKGKNCRACATKIDWNSVK